MYLVEIDPQGEIVKISQRLGSMHDKAPQVLASALNSTRTKTTTLIKNAIKKRYTYQRKDKLKDAISYQKASKQHLDTTIFIRSEAPHLSDFKISPTAPSNSDYGAAKAQVLKSGKIAPLDSTTGAKAFIARFANEKIAVVQRVPGKQYSSSSALSKRIAKYGKKADPTRIQAFYGPRLPSMAKIVYTEDIEADTQALLDENIQKQIDKVIKKAMEGR